MPNPEHLLSGLTDTIFAEAAAAAHIAALIALGIVVFAAIVLVAYLAGDRIRPPIVAERGVVYGYQHDPGYRAAPPTFSGFGNGYGAYQPPRELVYVRTSRGNMVFQVPPDEVETVVMGGEVLVAYDVGRFSGRPLFPRRILL